MKREFWGAAVLAVVLAVVLGAASPAAADVRTLAKAQSWETFGGTSSNGTGVCGISASPGGRYFGLKLFAGNDRFAIQVGTPDWKQLPLDVKVPVTMRFDANGEWNAQGTSFRFNDGDMGLQLYVNRSEINTFSSEFRDSSVLRLKFADSRLKPWVVGLEGTSQVHSAFVTCIRTLK